MAIGNQSSEKKQTEQVNGNYSGDQSNDRFKTMTHKDQQSRQL